MLGEYHRDPTLTNTAGHCPRPIDVIGGGTCLLLPPDLNSGPPNRGDRERGARQRVDFRTYHSETRIMGEGRKTPHEEIFQELV